MILRALTVANRWIIVDLWLRSFSNERLSEVEEKLPEFEQDALAESLLAMIATDAGWDDLLSKSEDKLERLADRALEAYKRGDIELLDPKKL